VPRPREKTVFPWIATVIAAAAVALAVWLYFGRPPGNPIDGAKVTPITKLDSDQLDGVISPDGKYVLYISDQNGLFDIWIYEVATKAAHPWSPGGSKGSDNFIRNMGFTGDGWIWNRPYASGGNAKSGNPQITPRDREVAARRFLEPTASLLTWSPDGKRLVYILTTAGDPMYVADGQGTNAHLIPGPGKTGVHNHPMAWSLDGEWIYFTRGSILPVKADIWRIRPNGKDPEQITHQNRMLGYPTPIDDRTILYVATDEDGLGPWLWAVDVKTQIARQVSNGPDEYLGLSGTADGRRLVATIARVSSSPREVPIILDGLAEDKDVKKFDIPDTERASGLRFGGDSVFFLSSSDGRDGVWWEKHGQKPIEIWKGKDGAIVDPPVVSGDGKQVAFVRQVNGRPVWHVCQADGNRLHSVGDGIDIHGSATWSPEGDALLAGGSNAEGPGLFLIPANGGATRRIVSGVALNPAWSKDNLIVYEEADVMSSAPLKFIRPNGDKVDFPAIEVNGPQSGRFLPNGTGFIYRQREDFWRLDLLTKEPRRLTELTLPSYGGSFDLTPDGKAIIFDRVRKNSDISLIDLAPR